MMTTSFRFAAVVFLLYFVTLKAGAQETPQLSHADRVRLAETFRLGEQLGERVWKGWSRAPFAVLLVTPEHEFLVRHPAPPKDFAAKGFDTLLGGDVLFRKRVFQPNLLATFPVGGVSTIVIGQPENTSKTSTAWVVTALHEHFHQLQDSQPDFYREANALGLARGDETGMWMLNFPFPYETAEVNARFSELTRALEGALRSVETRQFPLRLSTYLEARKRFVESLAADDYKYFSFQLWKEGVARYVEYRIAKLAATHRRPGKEFRMLKDFTPYDAVATSALDQILSELPRLSLSKYRRVAFYYVGAAEALLLDRANPRWQRRYLTDKFFMEKYFGAAGGYRASASARHE